MPGLSVLWSFGFLRSLTSHCWISSEAKQLTNRYLSSGDWRRSAGSLPTSHSLRAVYLPASSPSHTHRELSRAQLVKPWLAPSFRDQRHSSGAPPVFSVASTSYFRKSQINSSLPKRLKSISASGFL